MDNSLEDAINEAGLTDKIRVGGKIRLSVLDEKERVSVLAHLGRSVSSEDQYEILSQTALNLKKTGGQIQDIISVIPTQSNNASPVVNSQDLYVRTIYRELYHKLIQTSSDIEQPTKNLFVIIGTSGIGKSVFLIYFLIRLLANSNDDRPPIILLQVQDSRCYSRTCIIA